MAVIETKFSVGDVVFCATTTLEKRQHPCPDCLGSREWEVHSPGGGVFKVTCPRCSQNYMDNSDLSLDYVAHAPRVQRLTLGSIEVNTNKSTWNQGPRYMAHETGIGSGQVYTEDDLFVSEEDAHAMATVKATLANAEQKGTAFQSRSRTARFCDYQLKDASIEAANSEKSRALYKIGDLISDIEDAETLDDVRRSVRRFRGEEEAA